MKAGEVYEVVGNGGDHDVIHFYALGTKVEITDPEIDAADCVECRNINQTVDKWGNERAPYALLQSVSVDHLKKAEED